MPSCNHRHRISRRRAVSLPVSMSHAVHPSCAGKPHESTPGKPSSWSQEGNAISRDAEASANPLTIAASISSGALGWRIASMAAIFYHLFTVRAVFLRAAFATSYSSVAAVLQHQTPAVAHFRVLHGLTYRNLKAVLDLHDLVHSASHPSTCLGCCTSINASWSGSSLCLSRSSVYSPIVYLDKKIDKDIRVDTQTGVHFFHLHDMTTGVHPCM